MQIVYQLSGVSLRFLAMSVVRVGVGCIVKSLQHPGCVLLGKRLGSHGAGSYALPGGHLEMHESWAECATREVKEETNLTIENLQFYHVTNDPHINGTEKHYITIFMVGQVSADSPELQNLEPNKCERWDWIRWEDLIEKKITKEIHLFDPMIHLIEGVEHNKEPWFLK